jgi:regulator of sirC expression with transglutaminase-like and TPR domain
MTRIWLFLLLWPICAMAAPSPYKLRTLYNSLDTLSIAQHLAFYQLYPQTPDGERALNDAWRLLTGSSQATKTDLPFLFPTIDRMIAVVNKPIGSPTPSLSETELQAIESLAASLPHRRLKGHLAIEESQVQALEPADIDLARGILLSQLEKGPETLLQIRSYEATLDMMALQIQARLPPEATPEAKICAINSFIFEEMGFRFPPHSLLAKEIDLYTFLPSVLDSHRGVCLGVSILYICLAQRLNFALEMVTPPGHIYVRHRADGKEINIETTARGIHLDSKEYLGIDTRSLQQRTIKEVIGMAHYNQASVYWQQGDFDKAIQAYQKALPYMPDDKPLKELLGYNYLFKGQKEEGEKLLREVVDYLPEEAVSKKNIAEDYLLGLVDAEGIRTTFMEVDDTRDSILKKKKELEKVLESYPRFRSGLLHLAITWLQLHRTGEALEALERYHEIDPSDPTVQYYLAELYYERFDYQKAWLHLKNAQRLCQERQHAPIALKELRRDIAIECPE